MLILCGETSSSEKRQQQQALQMGLTSVAARRVVEHEPNLFKQGSHDDLHRLDGLFPAVNFQDDLLLLIQVD